MKTELKHVRYTHQLPMSNAILTYSKRVLIKNKNKKKKLIEILK